MTGTSGPVGPTRGLKAAGRSVTDIWFFIRLLSNIDLDVFCVFFCVILLLATGGWAHRACPTHLGCHAHARQLSFLCGHAWHVRKTDITWLPVNNFKTTSHTSLLEFWHRSKRCNFFNKSSSEQYNCTMYINEKKN